MIHPANFSIPSLLIAQIARSIRLYVFFFFLRQRCNNASIGLKCYFAEKSGRASGSLRLEIEMETFVLRFVSCRFFLNLKPMSKVVMKIVLLKIDRLRLKFLEIDRLNTRVHGGKKKKKNSKSSYEIG